ncbi:2-oxoacid:acceptor oxidoreductase family protein [Desulfosudis oleivorans]|uniref:2-oxoacid:acceptor oxidoreductase family protein n=1 Tax=Desulfosudis oleivorans TaxID=181663 RepID=UPI0022B74AD7|nr:2-oxoacid:acceptor oxidoreductase family protein [Desulfosudis oleivorans]
MPIDINILIGGAAGQGIQTVGDLLVQVCRKSGLHVFAVNGYESRIRGGHSNVQVRISDQPVKAPCRPVHLLLAMTDETIDRHRDRLAALWWRMTRKPLLTATRTGFPSLKWPKTPAAKSWPTP